MANYNQSNNPNTYSRVLTKQQTVVKTKNPQDLKVADYKNEINSINSIISREIEQMIEPNQKEIVVEQSKKKPKPPPMQNESLDEPLNMQDDFVDDFGLLGQNAESSKKNTNFLNIFNDED